MASTLDLYIDTSSGQLIDGGSVIGGALPTFTRNDAYTLRLRLLEKKANGSLDDIDFASSSLKVGIGNIEESPSGGSFKLAINGITSSAIAYNSTAISVYNAISNNVSTVALYGTSTYGSYLLTATQPNTAMSFSSDAFTLFPTSSVLVSTRRNPATSIEAQQVVKLVRNPIVYADTFTATPTANELALTLLQNGTTAANETYELTVGPLARGGSFALVFGSNATTAIPLFQSAVSVQASISSGINTITSNISVQENGKGGYIIAFTGRLGLTNVTTELKLDASGIQFIPMRQTTLTINTAEVEDAFADTAESTITPTLEIELTQGGTPKTIYQGNATIRKDLITAGSTVPGARDSYYTKSEADALFVEDSTSNVDATNRKLYNSGGSAFLDWQNNTIGTGSTVLDLSGTAVTITDGYNLGIGATTGTKIGVSTSSKIGFFGSTPIVQPTSSNVVTNLVNLGLIASAGITYGIFPQSTQTLTTTASLSFGTLAGHSTSAGNVTVTGAAVGDLVMVGLPAVVSGGIIVQGVVFAANTVCMTAINGSNASKTVGTADYRITVIDY
jgi:hypothetical protein